MEHFYFLRYAPMYETTGNTPATGEATPAGYPIVGERGKYVGGGAETRRIQELRVSMVPRVPRERIGRASPQPNPGTAVPVIRQPERESGKGTSEGTHGIWIPNKPMDTQAHRRCHRRSIRHRLSSQSCLANTPRDGMELPKAGASGTSEERR